MPDSETQKNEWRATLEQADKMGTRLSDDGWQVVTVRAAHVTPIPPTDDPEGRPGLAYIAQGEVAEPFQRVINGGTFDNYEVFNRAVGSDIFSLTRVSDTENEVAVLLVGTLNRSSLETLPETAIQRGELYSHVDLLDGTRLGSFHHSTPSLFFPGESE
ncbi:hypothetical protein DM867_07555 [Halosegnis rubeus]|uniref:Uncharacterized protein n=1 Tax=Halosegnis rubeus TaxID=2212850 RepID=A0A5N5UK70_9EURY|nr:hypothetical protein [Halosegnis rubeus]KAB7514951.1 hypothetical protein DM867_07555 [Halosegnis rubeus]KAB7518260.1 hypothetical protein DMP03_02545 [Halosegnis rubeus]KAB7519160.1 hypothetical protein DP108_03360 [Halosegnis rubeus]